MTPMGEALVSDQACACSQSGVRHETVAARGIDVEVIDLRTVAPLDTPTILESLSRTGRLLIAHEAVTDFGIGAEIAAAEGFGSLDAPVTRIGAARTPAPYAPNLEQQWLPDRNAIERAIVKLVHS